MLGCPSGLHLATRSSTVDVLLMSSLRSRSSGIFGSSSATATWQKWPDNLASWLRPAPFSAGSFGTPRSLSSDGNRSSDLLTGPGGPTKHILRVRGRWVYLYRARCDEWGWTTSSTIGGE